MIIPCILLMAHVWMDITFKPSLCPMDGQQPTPLHLWHNQSLVNLNLPICFDTQIMFMLFTLPEIHPAANSTKGMPFNRIHSLKTLINKDKLHCISLYYSQFRLTIYCAVGFTCYLVRSYMLSGQKFVNDNIHYWILYQEGQVQE